VTVVGPGDLSFRDFPGRTTADPFKAAGQGESTVREVVIEHVPSRSPHLHPISEEIVYVVAGRGQVWLDGTFHPVGPGTWYRIPSGTPHATLAAPGERLSLVCFFPHDHFAENIEELDMHLEYPEEDVDD
jgi:quercetin dioxygenase-like cupin family protein